MTARRPCSPARARWKTTQCISMSCFIPWHNAMPAPVRAAPLAAPAAGIPLGESRHQPLSPPLTNYVQAQWHRSSHFRDLLEPSSPATPRPHRPQPCVA